MHESFQNIERHVFQVLESKLPSYLTYHSVEHTRYVLKKAIFIASKENVSKDDLILLKIAALYHDIGFIKSPIQHEKVGCKIARKELKAFNLSQEDIDKICGMIMATKIPQQPITHLEEILADADLEYLGTRYFFSVGELLYKERKYFDPTLTKKKWNEIQVNFIKNHKYFTKFCLHYKEHHKLKNLKKII